MRWLVLVLALAGCGDKGSTGTTPNPSTGSPGGTPGATPSGAASGTASGSGSGTLPTDPRPITISFTGAFTGDIVFDTPTCANYPAPAFTNFRAFWRGSAHNAVLIAEVLTDFAGAGSYETGTHNLRVKLQTEAGTVYSFDAFAVDTAQGDSATMTVDHVSDIAYGSFDFTGMHSATGAIAASPSTVPIWCELVEN